MAVLPLVPGFFAPSPRPARPGQPSTAPSSGGRSTGGLRWNPEAIGQGFGPPGIRPRTPPQPGSSPSPPLGPWFLLGLGLGALGKLIWDALNYRPPNTARNTFSEEDVELFGGASQYFQVRITRTDYVRITRNCDTGDVYNNPEQNLGSQTYQSDWLYGKGLIYGGNATSRSSVCGPGTNVNYSNVLVLGYIDAQGERAGLVGGATGAVTYEAGYAAVNRSAWGEVTLIRPGGAEGPVEIGSAGEFAPGQRPQLPPIETQPLPRPAPAPVPAVAPLPAAVPTGTPAPRPSTAPGGAPAPSRRSAPGAPAPAPSPAPATAPALPNAVPLGPIVAPPAPIVAPPVVTPRDAVVLDGQVVGGPGLAPAPTLTAMAAELGRLERKGEMTLERLQGLSALDGLAELLPDLLEFLGTLDAGTTYSIQPPCGTKANGDPLDPVEVIVPPTVGPENALIARLDALAMLIDEHKSIRQPICKGKPAGAPVTVTGVEVEP